MRRIFTILVLLVTALLLLTSCSIGKAGNESEAAVNASASSSNNTAAVEPSGLSTNAASTPEASSPASSAAPESSQQNVAAPAEGWIDSGLTLADVKKAAQDAGNEVEDIPDEQLNMEPRPVGGFIVIIKSENNASYVPVYEFKSVADAQEGARQVNELGYGLAIVNGKLLTTASAKYGIITDENEKTFLETLLKSKVMAYDESALPKVSQDKDYAGAFTRIDAIRKALDKLVNKSWIIYTKPLPKDDSNTLGSIIFSLFSSADLSFTAILCEDQAKIDAVAETWEKFGCTDVKIKHDVANDYTMTGIRAGMDDPFKLHCIYNPDKDSLRIVDINGSDLVELFEFVPLGSDKYAFQSLYERGIVEYKDGKITSLTYSKNQPTKELANEPDADSIYPDGTGVDAAWVSKSGEDKYEQFITFDGTKLHISATDFMSNKIKADINVE